MCTSQLNWKIVIGNNVEENTTKLQYYVIIYDEIVGDYHVSQIWVAWFEDRMTPHKFMCVMLGL